MIFLLRYWQPIGSALLTAFFAWLLHGWDVGHIKAQYDKALAEQSALLQAECRRDQKITEGVSGAYQEKLAALDAALTAAKRVRKCATVGVSSPNSTPGRDAAKAEGKLPQPDGILVSGTTDDFYNLAGDAEQVGLKLDACQAFVRQALADYE